MRDLTETCHDWERRIAGADAAPEPFSPDGNVDGRLEAENRWETPAAWRAVIEHDRVAEWRVYADLEPLRAVMRRHSDSD